MHCSLACSACGNCAAAEIAGSYSFIDAYICISSLSVTEFAGELRRLLYSPIAACDDCWSDAARRVESSSSGTGNCAWQLPHSEKRFFPEIGKIGMKKNVHHWR